MVSQIRPRAANVRHLRKARAPCSCRSRRSKSDRWAPRTPSGSLASRAPGSPGLHLGGVRRPTGAPAAESYWGHVNPVGPRGVYDEAGFAEAMTMAYRRFHGVETAIVRIFRRHADPRHPRPGPHQRDHAPAAMGAAGTGRGRPQAHARLVPSLLCPPADQRREVRQCYVDLIQLSHAGPTDLRLTARRPRASAETRGRARGRPVPGG